MNAPKPHLLQGHKPASFTERGVAVPFTAPQLAGARIRRAERTGTEFVVPNPSGGRGVYILDWGAVRQLCRPTVHDTLLHQRISRLPVMDPSSVRVTARQLAAEGLAGKDATIAAAAAAEHDRNELVLLNFLLLVMLMEQVEPAGLRISPETEHTPELDQRAQRIITRVAASIGRTAEQARLDLETLSAQFASVGLDAEMPIARSPKLAARLEIAAASLTDWSRQYPDDGCSGLAASLSRSAAVTARCAETAFKGARALTLDMRGLLQAWVSAPAEISRLTHRADWILDGWDRFAMLWEMADHISVQRAALLEMAQLVPMLPKDGGDLGDARRELEKLEPTLRASPLNTSWRGGGASQGLIARNERLQALIV